jgi:myo-inositol-1(or 4)-monophosphatase
MEPTLREIEDLARGAGEILRAGYSRERQVYSKGGIDLVTDVDHQSEDYLLGEVRRRYPGHSIVSEERGALPGQSCCQWYIDPMDGTVNFAHGVPIFCVSIGYEQDGLARLGVVYDPMRDEVFCAEAGGGAWLNGKPLRVSGADSLDRSLLVTGFPYDIRTNPENNLDLYAHFALHSHGVRRLGSAAMDLSYVAAGRFDGYWEIRISPWDVAAGGLIATEAGAIVTTTTGAADYVTPPCSILAATPGIHAEMLAVFQALG